MNEQVAEDTMRRAIRAGGAEPFYTPDDATLRRLGNDFKCHKPVCQDQADRYSINRDVLHDAAVHMAYNCPPSRELSLAFTKLEEAMFWANAAIARNEHAR